MKFNIKHIIEGITNSVFVKEEIEKLAEYRMSICTVCPRLSSNADKDFGSPGKYFSAKRPDIHCTMCACNIHAKVRSLHTSCPEKRWPSVASKEEAAKVAAVTDAPDKLNIT
jgi:hypothetical protein